MPPPPLPSAGLNAGGRNAQESQQRRGDWSPVLIPSIPEGDEELVEHEEADLDELRQLRKAVLQLEDQYLNPSLIEEQSKDGPSEDALFARESAKMKNDAEDGEIQFGK